MKRSILSTAILASIFTTPSYSETVLDEIVIGAEFRPTAESDTPASVSVVNETDIDSRGAEHLEDIIKATPNVNSAGGGSRNKFFQIRGIGERSQFSTPLNPSIGLIIDGVDYSRTGGAATLFDIQQVEVLRGPQGTQYGASALAGIINIESNPPTKETEVKLETNIGSNNLIGAGFAAGGSLSDDVQARVSIYKNTSDGYMTNTYLNRDDTQNIDELTSKLQLKWIVDETLTIDVKAMHLDIDNGYDAFSFDNDYTTTTDEPGTDTLQSNSFAISSDWKMNPQVVMQTNFAHANSDSTTSYDDDWTFVNQYIGGYNGDDRYDRERTNNSIDLRWLSSEQGRIFNNSTDWVFGIFNLNQSEDLHRVYTSDDNPDWNTDMTSSYETTNRAVYGQLDHHLSSATKVSIGARAEQFSADYSDSYGFSHSTDENLFGGKLGLEHDLSSNHTLFTSLSKGYKAGGVNNDGNLPTDKVAFDTEYLWNLEAGINSSLLNEKLKTRLTTFYTLRKNQQVNSSTQEANSQEFTIYLDNAAEGKNYGLELEADFELNNQWRLFGSLGLLNSTFIDYTYVDPNDDTNTISLDGREQAHAPSYQYSIGGEYYFAKGWTARANIEGKDAFYFSNSNDTESDSFNIINASLEYATGNWIFTAWARNITDVAYDTRGYYFGIDPSLEYDDANGTWGYDDGLYTQKAEPRTFGLNVRWDY